MSSFDACRAPVRCLYCENDIHVSDAFCTYCGYYNHDLDEKLFLKWYRTSFVYNDPACVGAHPSRKSFWQRSSARASIKLPRFQYCPRCGVSYLKEQFVGSEEYQNYEALS